MKKRATLLLPTWITEVKEAMTSSTAPGAPSGGEPKHRHGVGRHSAPESKTGSHKKRPRVTFTQILGEILLTAGILFFLFAFYESYWTNIASGKAQNEANNQLQNQWDNERVNPRKKITPELGAAFARMYIPAFGSDFQFAIVEGTSDADLEAGPGHYQDTQLPGEKGNFAVAGHRVGKGAPFNDLGNLRTCDAVVVETQNAWNVYRVLPIDSFGEQRRAEAERCLTPEQIERVAHGDYSNISGRYITTPGDVNTISSLPGTDITTAGEDMESVMTMTTCHPQFSNAERMIVHAMLTETIPKNGSGEKPAALEEK